MNIELLAPAGDMERLKVAIAYGADAVYLGGKMFGMRTSSNNFTNEELKEAVEYAHERNVKIFVTCNITPTDVEIDLIPEFFKYLSEINVDGLIVSDIGVLFLAKEYAPNLEIHMSTQAGIVNHAAANSLYKLGVKRVVLARELTFEQIKNIRNNTPKDLEIEAFVHGSMCMAFSGRCLLSQYMNNRDANRGDCSQACRWKYKLVEEKSGEAYPIEESETGTHILNSKDMCMIEYIDKLVDCGIGSFKIEGRAKSAYYVAIITNAYRHAIDYYYNNKENFVLPEWIKEEVYKVSHRHYSTGFYFGHPDDGQFYDNGGYVRNYNVVAVVEDYIDGQVILSQRNKFLKGDEVEIIEPKGKPFTVILDEIFDEKGNEIDAASHATMIVKFKYDKEIKKGAFVRIER